LSGCHYPEFENLIEKHNIVHFVETKTDDIDEIKLPGYKFHMKNRKTNSRVKSGGIIIGYQEQFHKNIEVLPLSVLPSVQDIFRRIFLSNC
jgi:hypothetical protein